MNNTRRKATQKPTIQRRYRKQDEACEQAIKSLLAKAAGVPSSNGGHSDIEGKCHVKRANDQSGITNDGFTKVRTQE